ncbi:hypothetical protein HMPREF0519_2602 [Lentilactobacillus hilgardii DSM 20176 = ATCC 8290]|uniref:Uncharacterized protein n=1 Tax=Lentilactobacillus hilgardii (strain ATCC 8290 / DSM 20176 / CCUG 30140 / JCM 1155 / KCTC 3500 / NBRC 15886 / NCIMB 8040 / NRRL B-1843 / 9) TaxID=1423757 RepID=C0XMZ1_LENH9|nr:hypothetical protein HMPREF0519_2602 [Lentilactobacillus hilgardii DSM 20176 = ATCC 8290]
MAKQLLNEYPTAKRIVGQYQPGIIVYLVEQYEADYKNPRNVKIVVNTWLGINSLEE